MYWGKRWFRDYSNEDMSNKETNCMSACIKKATKYSDFFKYMYDTGLK